VHRVVAVVICAPTFEHEAIVRAALQSGGFEIVVLFFSVNCFETETAFS